MVADKTDVILQAMKRTVSMEVDGLKSLNDSLGENAVDVVKLFQGIEGRVICAGVGKSGHVARKISATLASTGTSSFFVHPAEASHGDLGMISEKDAVLALSKSGETKELSDLIAYCRRFSVPLIGMTMFGDSTLAKNSDKLLLIPNAKEACGETRAPTTSTTLMMAMGDALAVALIELSGFTAEDFKRYHPGGSLGAALTSADEIMHEGDKLPLVRSGTLMPNAVKAMSEKGFGCVGIVDQNSALIGILTDGDLRRHFLEPVHEMSVDEVMTTTPIVAQTGMLAADVLRLMTGGERKLTQVFVCDESGQVKGFIHMHDLLKIGVS